MARSAPSWGWHELEPRWAERLVDWSAVGRGDLVLDVGAGRGALTAQLLNAGARVVAIELHPDRAAHLRTQFGRDVTVVRADAADLRLPRRPFHVVANPPFAITSSLLRRLLSPGSRLLSAHLVVSRQAARRWCGPRAPARARWSSRFDVVERANVPRRAFRPAPHVDACVVEIARTGRRPAR